MSIDAPSVTKELRRGNPEAILPPMNLGPEELLVFAVLFGAVTGAIGYSWRRTPRDFARFFLLGTLVPFVGLVIALAVRRYLPTTDPHTAFR